MGYGDSLFAAGHAERIYKQDPLRGPIAILDPSGKVRWNPVWDGNPAIYRGRAPSEATRRIVFGGAALPYFPPLNTPTGKVWPTGWRVRDQRPSLYLTADERAFGDAVRQTVGPFVLLEPTGKDRLSPNRVWPLERWQTVADTLKTLGVTVVQLDRPDANPLRGVYHVSHGSFREACGVLSACQVFCGTEGGLSVAAGALRAEAVILVSPCGPPPEVIGFPEHTHLMDDGPGTPCGYMTPCAHCAAAWQRLAPETVVTAILEAVH